MFTSRLSNVKWFDASSNWCNVVKLVRWHFFDWRMNWRYNQLMLIEWWWLLTYANFVLKTIEFRLNFVRRCLGMSQKNYTISFEIALCQLKHNWSKNVTRNVVITVNLLDFFSKQMEKQKFIFSKISCGKSILLPWFNLFGLKTALCFVIIFIRWYVYGPMEFKEIGISIKYDRFIRFLFYLFAFSFIQTKTMKHTFIKRII